MLLYKVKDFKELSRKAANIISAQVILKPTSVLGLATGSTPVGTYKQLIEWYEREILIFHRSPPSTWMNTRGSVPLMSRVIAIL